MKGDPAPLTDQPSNHFITVRDAAGLIRPTMRGEQMKAISCPARGDYYVVMPRMPHESVATWYERAIVADSLAADEMRQMDESPVPFNEHANAAITRRARSAEKDLSAALSAYTDQRGTDAGSGS